MKLVTVQEMIRIERAADALGHTYQKMMEAAGKGIAEIIRDQFGNLPEKNIIALVGSGNNGGDALVALDYLLSWGWQASALLLKSRSPEDELIQRVIKQAGRVIDCSEYPQNKETIANEIKNAYVLMDGVFGTGVNLPIKEPLSLSLNYINEIINDLIPKPIIIAVDCPSGMDCDTGEVDKICIAADLTITMAAIKKGMLQFPAANYIGDLQYVDIDLPPELPALNEISREVIGSDVLLEILPERPLNAHKGNFGCGLIIAGSKNYPGAAILAARAAYKIGTGLITLAVPQTIYSGIIGSIPEATWLALEDQAGYISVSAVNQVQEALVRPTACLIGPGFGTQNQTKEFLDQVLRLEGLPPLVLDADGLRIAAEISDWPKNIPSRSVLTPHPGEMSLLTGLTVKEIESNRIAIAESYAKKWNQIVVLKGAFSIIADPGGQTRIIGSANPALSTAGTGDVLAGIIVGLIAQGVPSFDAASAGAWIHAQAGEIAEIWSGDSAAVLAGDVSEAIGYVLSEVYSEIKEKTPGK